MTTNHRPLSPHLQIYRWEITMFLSILHRMTGLALAVGAFVLTYWLYALFMAGTTLTDFYLLAKSPVGILTAFGWLFALVYHLLNGLRHIVWDFGYGVNSKAAKRSGWFVLLMAFALTTLIWNHARGVYASAEDQAAQQRSHHIESLQPAPETDLEETAP